MDAPHLSGSLVLECRKQTLHLLLRKSNTLCPDMVLHKLLSKEQYTWPIAFIFLNTFLIVDWNTYYVLDTGKSVANERDKIGL